MAKTVATAVAFKGTTCEKCFDGGTIPPKGYNIHACDLLYKLEEKSRSSKEGHTVGSAWN
jgi:hypothetical protein